MPFVEPVLSEISPAVFSEVVVSSALAERQFHVNNNPTMSIEIFTLTSQWKWGGSSTIIARHVLDCRWICGDSVTPQYRVAVSVR
jgi:hypothetical protein